MSTAIVLVTYGEPTTPGFFAQWMYSLRILRQLTRKIARIPAPLLPVIATARALGRRALWSRHGFGSPLEPATEETVRALARALEGRAGGPYHVCLAYEFRRPLITDTLAELERRPEVDRVVIVPMYMGTGDFTCGLTQSALAVALARRGWDPARVSMCRLTDPAPWLDRVAEVSASYVVRACAARGLALPDPSWALCLAAHGSVQTPAPGVDNGVAAFGELVWRIAARLGGDGGVFGRVRNGWLNHTRGGRWTEPSVARLLPRLRAAGFQKLVYYSWGFTTSNAESALEGQLVLDAMDDPFDEVVYLPCLDDDPEFVALLADRIEDHHATPVVAAP